MNTASFFATIFAVAMLGAFGKLLFFHLQLFIYNVRARDAVLKPAVLATLAHNPWEINPEDRTLLSGFDMLDEIRRLVAERGDIFDRDFQERFERICEGWYASIGHFFGALGVVSVLAFALFLMLDDSSGNDEPEIYGAGAPVRMHPSHRE